MKIPIKTGDHELATFDLVRGRNQIPKNIKSKIEIDYLDPDGKADKRVVESVKSSMFVSKIRGTKNFNISLSMGRFGKYKVSLVTENSGESEITVPLEMDAWSKCFQSAGRTRPYRNYDFKSAQECH